MARVAGCTGGWSAAVRRAACSAVSIAVLGSLMLGGSGCSTDQLGAMQFHKDNRLTFTSPRARSVVKLPLTISWRMDDFGGAREGGSEREAAFGVFVDRSPIAVGTSLESLAEGDESCERDPRCPDPSYLADNGVFVTAETSLELTTLPRVAGVGDEQHTVTVVLLDDAGVRRVESSWYLEFRLPRRS